MTTALVWFRQDLRCEDNPALSTACHTNKQILPLYIRDDSIALGAAQKWWLHHSLRSLQHGLKQRGLTLILRQGDPLQILPELVSRLGIENVYWNRCYTPSIIARDKRIKDTLKNQGISVSSFNGSLLNEPWTIKNNSGDYFKVFTPYWKHCLREMHIPNPACIASTPTSLDTRTDSLDNWNLLPKNPNWAAAFDQYWIPGENGAHKKLDQFTENHLKGYKTNRNLPALNATSKLSPHLHFGEISPWQIWRAIERVTLNPDCDSSSINVFLSEMGWREFSYSLLYHVPTLPEKNYKPQFDAFPWSHDRSHFKKWTQGKTGYPIIDAGMRELWTTGYMHNRVRMLVASFLTKNLHIDWRQGAAWFLDTLLDADTANNSSGWQWVAGSGADAAPYFRIFNPVLQSQKYDPEGQYIKRWVPELACVPKKWVHSPWTATSSDLGISLGKEYPRPIVNHDETRKQSLSYYSLIKDSK